MPHQEGTNKKMLKTLGITAIILIIFGAIAFAWLRTKEQTNLSKILAPGFQQEITISPTPTPTPSSFPESKEIKQTPTTGVSPILPVLGSAITGLVGWYLLKKKAV